MTKAKLTFVMAALVALTACGTGGSDETLVAFETQGDGFRQIPVEEALARQAAAPTDGAAVK